MRTGLLILFVCVLAGLASCNRVKLPADPGLAVDDLGIGISLGMPVPDAQQASHSQAKYWVITRDELVTKTPYKDKPEGRDLIIALYTDYPPGTAGKELKFDFGVVTEIRCYLGSTQDSPVMLLGQPAAGLTPEGIEYVLGPPLESITGSDGNTHLTYHFAKQDEEGKTDPKRMIRLTTSHSGGGNCFALLVSLDRVD